MTPIPHILRPALAGNFNSISLTQTRQIRNAFQTAIALVEHDALQCKDGDPAPVLSRTQFEIVAEASRQFDEYITKAIGMGETAMAVRDKWRADPHPRNAASTRKKPAVEESPVVSEDEIDSDSSSEESSEDDDSDGDDPESPSRKEEEKIGTKSRSRKGKAVEPAAEKAVSEDDLAQFKAFQRFQAMGKKVKRGK